MGKKRGKCIKTTSKTHKKFSKNLHPEPIRTVSVVWIGPYTRKGKVSIQTTLLIFIYIYHFKRQIGCKCNHQSLVKFSCLVHIYPYIHCFSFPSQVKQIQLYISSTSSISSVSSFPNSIGLTTNFFFPLPFFDPLPPQVHRRTHITWRMTFLSRWAHWNATGRVSVTEGLQSRPSEQWPQNRGSRGRLDRQSRKRTCKGWDQRRTRLQALVGFRTCRRDKMLFSTNY